MPEYTIQTEEMNHVMELLFHVLDIRITFCAPDDTELSWKAIKPRCNFCRVHRCDPEFLARCDACDHEHLLRAKQMRENFIYHCHAGLLEGFVPLYDKHQHYLGSIFFGQLSDRENPIPDTKVASVEEMYEIAKLLKYLGEYICENELIRQCAAPWSERAEAYIKAHLTEPISMARLAKHSGCSVSILSHNFSKVMGKTFKNYIRDEKIRQAKKLLHKGCRISECAEQLGYSDVFYFSKEFKRVTGMSPLNWQKKQVN